MELGVKKGDTLLEIDNPVHVGKWGVRLLKLICGRIVQSEEARAMNTYPAANPLSHAEQVDDCAADYLATYVGADILSEVLTDCAANDCGGTSGGEDSGTSCDSYGDYY
ncbi:MAG: hypothetical protein HYU64_15510 [Armatimonadetes bacterium]|nr:hypothetical protein [Armatimonadota bacterium]